MWNCTKLLGAKVRMCRGVGGRLSAYIQTFLENFASPIGMSLDCLWKPEHPPPQKKKKPTQTQGEPETPISG